MNGDRSEQALARIEAALVRLEAAAQRPRGSGDGADHARLLQKHEQLRAAVTQSLHQLDGLIGGNPA
jgi:hypothetical protein